MMMIPGQFWALAGIGASHNMGSSTEALLALCWCDSLCAWVAASLWWLVELGAGIVAVGVLRVFIQTSLTDKDCTSKMVCFKGGEHHFLYRFYSACFDITQCAVRRIGVLPPLGIALLGALNLDRQRFAMFGKGRAIGERGSLRFINYQIIATLRDGTEDIDVGRLVGMPRGGTMRTRVRKFITSIMSEGGASHEEARRRILLAACHLWNRDCSHATRRTRAACLRRCGGHQSWDEIEETVAVCDMLSGNCWPVPK